MARTTPPDGGAVNLDDLSDLAAKLIPIGVLMGMIVGLMRWLWTVSIRRQLTEMKTDILRAIRSERTDHERTYHDGPPPAPTWHRPDPNGAGPTGYVGVRRR